MAAVKAEARNSWPPTLLAYVDLNPFRARIADQPEVSARTAIHSRIRARQRHRVSGCIAERASHRQRL